MKILNPTLSSVDPELSFNSPMSLCHLIEQTEPGLCYQLLTPPRGKRVMQRLTRCWTQRLQLGKKLAYPHAPYSGTYWNQFPIYMCIPKEVSAMPHAVYDRYRNSVYQPPCSGENLPWDWNYTHGSSVRSRADFFLGIARPAVLFCASREHFSPQEIEHPPLPETVPLLV